MKQVLIPQNALAEYVGVSKNLLYTYLGHFTLFKYVRHKTINKIRKPFFILNHNSIYALHQYLKLKMGYNKDNNKIKISGIEKLKKYYEDTCTNF